MEDIRTQVANAIETAYPDIPADARVAGSRILDGFNNLEPALSYKLTIQDVVDWYGAARAAKMQALAEFRKPSPLDLAMTATKTVFYPLYPEAEHVALDMMMTAWLDGDK